jgi:hydroxymethylbilane synthase
LSKPSPMPLVNLLKIAARSSPLSQVQVQEVIQELRQFAPETTFDLTLVSTIGDRDQNTSLRQMDKTDFFTRDIDQLLLNDQCRIAIHSAKDLPDPIPEGLQIVAVTRGVDSSDSLVLRDGETLASLKSNAVIATSSIRREEGVRTLRSDLAFVDIRGNIGQRLQKLENGDVDGVVIAEAALLRLGLHHLNRIKIPGETVSGQGRLAILARIDDEPMSRLFSLIDCRKTAVHLGVTRPTDSIEKKYFHCPIIKIVPELEKNRPLPEFSHLIFTSQNAVRVFFSHYSPETAKGKIIVVVGQKTAKALSVLNIEANYIPEEETAEGVTALLDTLDLSSARLFWPHSALARPIITNYLVRKKIPHVEWMIYTTIPREPLPLPETFHELIFTSPSTVDAYILFFDKLPEDKILTPIGPVTANYLELARSK